MDQHHAGMARDQAGTGSHPPCPTKGVALPQRSAKDVPLPRRGYHDSSFYKSSAFEFSLPISDSCQ